MKRDVMSSLRSSHRLLWHGVKRIRTLTCISNSFVSSVSLSTRRCFYASPAVEAQSDNNSNGNDSHRDSDLAPFTTVRVSKDCEGMRLDAFIRHSYPWLNANFMHSLIRKRRIGLARTDLPPQKWVRSRPMRTDCRDPLQEGEVVVVPRSITHPPATDDPNETRTQIHTRGNESERARLYARKLGNDTTKVEELKGMASSIPVIFKDEHLLVVNKPGGLAVQSGASARPDIVKLLPFLQFEADVIPRLVHRLDREVSGLLMLARSRKAASLLGSMLRKKTISKEYIALVSKHVLPTSGRIVSFLEKMHIDGSTRVVVREEGSVYAKRSITEYDTVQRVMNELTMLRLNAITGRAHQLRVHCADVLDAPILGDHLYGCGTPSSLQAIIGNKVPLCLHSHRLQFEHPFTGKKLDVTVGPPSHFLSIMEDLGLDTKCFQNRT